MKTRCWLLLLYLAGAAHAERLSTAGMVTDPAAAQVVLDGDLATAWTSVEPQAAGMAIVVDAGKLVLVHRVILHTGANLSGLARGVALQVSPDGKTWHTVASAETLNEPDLDLCFNPAVGRFLRLQLTASAGYRWSLAEVELYGSLRPAALSSEVAIVLPAAARAPLQWAARELRYYLSEATGRFISVQPSAAKTGLVFVLSEQPSAEEAKLLQPLGEEGYVLRRAGREVRIVGASSRGVVYGCYEIIDRLGVKWLDPTPEGEFIPRGAKLDLKLLPVATGPSFTFRHFNGWNISAMPRGWLLWCVRNRINCPGQADWWYGKLDQKLGEIPARSRYLYGHYPHSFARTLPGGLYAQHPEMFPLRAGKRVPYDAVAGGGLQFCTTSPATTDYVTQHVIATLRARPDQIYSLCPNDGGVWCECPECAKLDEPLLPEAYSDGRPGATSVSDRFFTFMDTVCRRVATELPGRQILTIAYSNFDTPPRRLAKLPDNLLVDVCQYGCSSHGVNECATNAEMKRRMEAWAAKCSHVGVYDYTFDQMRVQKLPLPYCRAITSELNWLAEHNIRAYSTEGSGSDVAWLVSPWAYWTMARSLWDSHRTAAQSETEFFAAYYQEAAQSMLAYYQAMEDFAYDTPVHWGSYNNVPTADKFPPALLARLHECLTDATVAARQPVVQARVARQVEAIRFVEDYLRAHP